MGRRRSRSRAQHVASVLLVVFLIPLLTALLSWVVSLPPVHSVAISLLTLLVAVAVVFCMNRDLGRTGKRSLRTR